jgi:hypothetical protein
MKLHAHVKITRVLGMHSFLVTSRTIGQNSYITELSLSYHEIIFCQCKNWPRSKQNRREQVKKTSSHTYFWVMFIRCLKMSKFIYNATTYNLEFSDSSYWQKESTRYQTFTAEHQNSILNLKHFQKSTEKYAECCTEHWIGNASTH